MNDLFMNNMLIHDERQPAARRAAANGARKKETVVNRFNVKGMSEKISIAVIWSLATAVLTRLGSSWNLLPNRVATTFGMGSEAAGWDSREALLLSVVLLVVGQAVLATFLIMRLAKAVRFLPLVQANVSLVLVCGFWQVINYNLNHLPVQSGWLVAPVALLLVTVAVMLGSLGTPAPVQVTSRAKNQNF